MSRLFLDGFLNDVKGINPGFRTFTSSLRTLVNHLERTVDHPVPMTFDEAYRMGGGRVPSGRVKYRPAIRRLVSVWGHGPGRPYPRSAPASTALHQVDVKAICFRGDFRGPDEVFASGFSPWGQQGVAVYRGGRVEEVPGQANPVLDPLTGMKKAGDLDPSSAVCVTPDMHVAALFPLPVQSSTRNSFDPCAEDTWVYMVFVESGYNTYARQVLDALDGLSELVEFQRAEGAVVDPHTGQPVPRAALNDARVANILQNLYGREMATDRIDPTRIWYGMRISRSWNVTKTIRTGTEDGVRVGQEGDYKAGGTYRIVELRENFQAIYPPSPAWGYAADACAQLLTEKVERGTTFPLPTSASGYQPSDIRLI